MMTLSAGGVLFAAVLAPLSGAFLLPLVAIVQKKGVLAVAALFGVASAAATLLAALAGWTGPVAAVAGGWRFDLGIALVADRLSAVFLLVSAVGGSLALASSMEKFRGGPWRFYVLFFLLIASMNGIILTGDIFNLFVFYEIFSVAAYVLAAFSMTRDALEAGLKYLIFGTVAALFLLLGIAYVFMATGQLNMAALSGQVKSVPAGALTVISACFVLALSTKMGAFPTHFWLPDAHSSAQIAVSALLSGVLVKVSVYALIRISALLFLDVNPGVFRVILAIGTMSVLAGHLMAMQQEDIKRLLAYSTVAQIGYILIGIGCADALGLTASLYHALNHTVLKMGLFLAAGILAEEAQSRKIVEMTGLFASRPVITAAFAALAAGIVGIPPLNGFMSKWFLLAATLRGGHVVPALAISAGTVISAAYYLRVLKAFFSRGGVFHPHRETPLSAGIVVMLAIFCLAMGFLPFIQPLWERLSSAGAQALDVAGYVRAVTVP